MNDPWWIVVIKVVGVVVILLTWTIFNVWYERRVLGKMQQRHGPIMNGPNGLGQALGDGMKLLLKEDFRPARTDPLVFNLAPFLTGLAAFTMWGVIPLGGQVSMFGHVTRLQVSDLPVAVLFIIAIASLGIYGIVLAGWASNGTYSLLGSMRATAQMISYEVAMGLSLVAVFMYAGSMSTNQIVDAQSTYIGFWRWHTQLPGWYAALLIPSFLTYVISAFGETNRLPFDLAECETELVSGHITDYSGFRYAVFFLAEYINMGTVSAVATTLFLGGYRAPWPFNVLLDGRLDQGWFTIIWFVIKVQLLITVFVWVRAAIPRFRYDQFMNLGWKILIPFNLVWVLVLSVFRGGQRAGWFTLPVVGVVVGAILVLLLLTMWRLDQRDKRATAEAKAAAAAAALVPFDAFAGGYPVPPPLGDKVPRFADTYDPDPTSETAPAPRRQIGAEQGVAP
ncbi:MAG: NADH-quinone oxidoreductase subunit NuoH [Actinomycetia bacterium]|nr:NADH-quinone oxidoreductase subunit NuoH [Actinomycetes bacterium]